ncbi:hypothetical protein ES703_119514 [subsurface metagenome]
MECRIEKNMEMCNCTYEPCSRKGTCCECIYYHRSMNELPACYFSKRGEASYNRTIEAFIMDYQKR